MASSRLHRWGRRWYRVLLVAYPRAFRSHYGNDMASAFGKAVVREARTRGWWGVVAAWTIGSVDALACAIVERRRGTARRAARPRGEGPAAWARDLRYAVRVHWRRPAFGIIAVVTIGLGVGANTAIFTVVRSVLLKPLPYAEPDGLVLLRQVERTTGSPQLVSLPNFTDWESNSSAFDAMAAWQTRTATLTGTEQAARVAVAAVTSRFFQVLGVSPEIGLGFRGDEILPVANPTVVLDHGYWTARFGGDPGVVGTTITLDGRANRVVGVAPPGFAFPGPVDLWQLAPGSCGRGCFNHRVVARLAEGVSMEAARADLDVVARALASAYPEDNADIGIDAVSLHEHVVAEARPALVMLMVAVGLVLVIACSNLANLSLARASDRQVEVAVRGALGASRGRLVRQLLMETVVLGVVGGTAGLALAGVGVDTLLALAPAADIPRLAEVGVDGGVFVFAVAVSVGVGLGFGLLPALHLSGTRRSAVLRQGDRGRHHRGTGLVRDGLVVVQVAMAIALLVAAGLLVRSFANLSAVDPGFDPARTLTARVALSGARYNNVEARTQFFGPLLDRVRGVPGVENASATIRPPVTPGDVIASIAVERRTAAPPGQRSSASIRAVSPNFHTSIRIPLVAGRHLGPDDDEDSPRVVVISATMARELWPNGDALGERIALGLSLPGDDGETPWREVVGVVGNVKTQGLDDRDRWVVYVPYGQNPFSTMTLMIRTTGDPTAFVSTLRALVAEVDPNLAVYDVATMEATIARSVASPRFYAWVVASLASVAALLAVVGVYGLMSYTVSRRRHELGVRIALGARRGAVRRMVVGRGAAVTAVGVTVGIGLAVGATRLVESLLFGVPATDPLTVAGAAVLLTGVAVVASYLPARRASRVDPVIALRSD